MASLSHPRYVIFKTNGQLSPGPNMNCFCGELDSRESGHRCPPKPSLLSLSHHCPSPKQASSEASLSCRLASLPEFTFLCIRSKHTYFPSSKSVLLNKLI